MKTLTKTPEPKGIFSETEPEEQRQIRKGAEIVYPDSDGKPMADNTRQFNWIVKIKENLERIFADNPDVFIGGGFVVVSGRGEQ